MAAEIATEIAKGRGQSFDTRATALMLCRSRRDAERILSARS